MNLVVLYLLFAYFVMILLFGGTLKAAVGGNTRFVILLISVLCLNGLRLIGQNHFEDIENYREIYLTLPPLDVTNPSSLLNHAFLNDVDVGYQTLNLIFRLFGFNFELFLFAIFTAQIAVFYKFSNTFGINPVVSFATYVAVILMTFQLGMLRQAIAFCFFLVAIQRVDRKILFVALILIGATIHKSILFCLLLIWCDKRISLGNFFIVFSISVALYLLQIDLVALVFPAFKEFDDFARVFFYLDVDRDNNYLGVGFWERMLLFFSISAVRNELNTRGKETWYMNVAFNVAMFAIIFQIIFFSSPTITSRLRLYAQVFPLIYISHYIFTELKGGIAWAYRTLYVLYLSWYFTFQINYLIEAK